MVFKPFFIYRFYKRIDRQAGRKRECWFWIGAHNKSGYGHFPINRVNHGAHRISYEMHNGKIPKGLYVLHKCDNPKCVNPNHLFLGTNKDNVMDSIKKGRRNFKGEENPRAKLSIKQVIEIRKKYIPWKYSIGMLSKEYDVGWSTIDHIVKHQNWKHI